MFIDSDVKNQNRLIIVCKSDKNFAFQTCVNDRQLGMSLKRLHPFIMSDEKSFVQKVWQGGGEDYVMD